MKRWLISLTLLLTSCSSLMDAGSQPTGQVSRARSSPPGSTSEAETSAADVQVELDNFGPAPELHNEVWLNTQEPLRLSDLRGQVVLLEMWTFG